MARTTVLVRGRRRPLGVCLAFPALLILALLGSWVAASPRARAPTGYDVLPPARLSPADRTLVAQMESDIIAQTKPARAECTGQDDGCLFWNTFKTAKPVADQRLMKTQLLGHVHRQLAEIGGASMPGVSVAKSRQLDQPGAVVEHIAEILRQSPKVRIVFDIYNIMEDPLNEEEIRNTLLRFCEDVELVEVQADQAPAVASDADLRWSPDAPYAFQCMVRMMPVPTTLAENTVRALRFESMGEVSGDVPESLEHNFIAFHQEAMSKENDPARVSVFLLSSELMLQGSNLHYWPDCFGTNVGCMGTSAPIFWLDTSRTDAFSECKDCPELTRSLLRLITTSLSPVAPEQFLLPQYDLHTHHGHDGSDGDHQHHEDDGAAVTDELFLEFADQHQSASGGSGGSRGHGDTLTAWALAEVARSLGAPRYTGDGSHSDPVTVRFIPLIVGDGAGDVSKGDCNLPNEAFMRGAVSGLGDIAATLWPSADPSPRAVLDTQSSSQHERLAATFARLVASATSKERLNGRVLHSLMDSNDDVFDYESKLHGTSRKSSNIINIYWLCGTRFDTTAAFDVSENRIIIASGRALNQSRLTLVLVQTYFKVATELVVPDIGPSLREKLPWIVRCSIARKSWLAAGLKRTAHAAAMEARHTADLTDFPLNDQDVADLALLVSRHYLGLLRTVEQISPGRCARPIDLADPDRPDTFIHSTPVIAVDTILAHGALMDLFHKTAYLSLMARVKKLSGSIPDFMKRPALEALAGRGKGALVQRVAILLAVVVVVGLVLNKLLTRRRGLVARMKIN
ncbi:hypothetical protein H696_00923 [Fonticula alba]|uniref:Uncharacterized protein n=1 Tax=Fonticula alba TaxID=691883 RepID=A0A058ZG86_FONAL|nr:hypothetical protein H696_00923 [Fonticula alba]KCV73384.1 hypothetical protein H696_00923 [Fonticula alba]|eukprot:XP_009493085.1 hypothetical protein H696_00923 [Fonticula alba]